MRYVDGFLLAAPKRKLAAYRRMARVAARVWREHGALDYKECLGEDLGHKGVFPFPKAIRLKRGEVVIFSWIGYRSRAHRDRVNARVMQDPRIRRMMTSQPPFDMKRMCYGGFDVIVSG